MRYPASLFTAELNTIFEILRLVQVRDNLWGAGDLSWTADLRRWYKMNAKELFHNAAGKIDDCQRKEIGGRHMNELKRIRCKAFVGWVFGFCDFVVSRKIRKKDSENLNLAFLWDMAGEGAVSKQRLILGLARNAPRTSPRDIVRIMSKMLTVDFVATL